MCISLAIGKYSHISSAVFYSGTGHLRRVVSLPDTAFAHGAMGRRIDPSWGGPIELFLVPASAPQLV